MILSFWFEVIKVEEFFKMFLYFLYWKIIMGELFFIDWFKVRFGFVICEFVVILMIKIIYDIFNWFFMYVIYEMFYMYLLVILVNFGIWVFLIKIVWMIFGEMKYCLCWVVFVVKILCLLKK